MKDQVLREGRPGSLFRKVPQFGIVQLDDNVEIGANTTIDRARFGRTWIQEGVKIDNLVTISAAAPEHRQRVSLPYLGSAKLQHRQECLCHISLASACRLES